MIIAAIKRQLYQGSDMLLMSLDGVVPIYLVSTQDFQWDFQISIQKKPPRMVCSIDLRYTNNYFFLIQIIPTISLTVYVQITTLAIYFDLLFCILYYGEK